jgi:bisphosphoglycerate-dependent phosphoglycerate mutase
MIAAKSTKPVSRILNRRGVSHTVVMVRHGESVWNVEKRFTGWCDVPLTEHGIADASDAGSLMGERGMKFDVAFTSSLERAWKTCDIALKAAGQYDTVETIRSWKLNERHYGALQGHLKDSEKLLDTFGEEKILEWRRSYDTAPPSLYDTKFAADMGMESFARRSTTLMNPRFVDNRMIHRSVANRRESNQSLDDIGSDFPYPSSESLKQCEDRAYGYWMEVIAPRVMVRHHFYFYSVCLFYCFLLSSGVSAFATIYLCFLIN